MGVNIISSSRVELEFEECPYCHYESAVKHEYIADAKGGWDVVKYTCLKCASQFIYNCRDVRPHPILIKAADDWLHTYTTESEVWREHLGYKRIEKPKEESMEDKAIIKFKADEFDSIIRGCRIGDTMKFDGKTYVAMDQLAYDNGCYDCDLCQECQDLHNGDFATDKCNVNVIFKEKEEAVKESQDNTSDDLSIFYDYSKDDFEHLFNFRVGFKFRYGNKMYEVAEVAKAPTTEFCCYEDCALYKECCRSQGGYTDACPSNIYFKECCTKKQSDDKDYQGDLRTVFSFPVGHEFRYGDSKVAVRKSRYAKAEDSYLDCSDCAFRKECGEADAGCPSDKWYEVIGKSEPKEEPKKEEAKPVDAKKDYSTVDFTEIFKLNDGDEFRFGDSIYKAMSKDPGKWEGCSTDCDLYDYCYDDDGALCLDACPGSRYYKKLGCMFSRCPSCGEYALKVCLNASRAGGVTKHALNLNMVSDDDGIPDVDKQSLKCMTDAALVVCTRCGSRHGSFGGWRNKFKPVHSFIDDGDKLVDFFKLSKEEFLKSYSYLTEEEYEATLEAIKSRTK